MLRSPLSGVLGIQYLQDGAILYKGLNYGLSKWPFCMLPSLIGCTLTVTQCVVECLGLWSGRIPLRESMPGFGLLSPLSLMMLMGILFSGFLRTLLLLILEKRSAVMDALSPKTCGAPIKWLTF